MEWEKKTKKTKLDAAYRVSIPAEFRDALGASPGDLVLVTGEAPGQLLIRTYPAAIREIQEWARPYAREGVSVVDEFIAERRAEAARE